jgi:hypothetical protein
MAFPPSNLIQFPARAEPPEFPTLPPPPPAPPAHQNVEWGQDVVAELGVFGWLMEELQYLMPFEARTDLGLPAPVGTGLEPLSNDHLPYLGAAAWGEAEIQYLMPWEVRAATPDQFPETPSVDKFPFKGEMPPAYYELEGAAQESAQTVLALVATAVNLVSMWEKPFSVHQWEIEEPVYTESYLELTMSVYPADPASLLRPWQTPFDDPMPAAEDTAAWQEYAKLDLEPTQRPEATLITKYWQGWELPPAYPVEIEPAAQEAAGALLSPFYVGQAELVFVVDYQRPFELPEWPVDDPFSLLSFTAQVVNPPSGPKAVLFVTPQLEGGFRFSRF